MLRERRSPSLDQIFNYVVDLERHMQASEKLPRPGVEPLDKRRCKEHPPVPLASSQDLMIDELTKISKTLTSDMTKLKQKKERLASRLPNQPTRNLAPFGRPLPHILKQGIRGPTINPS
jgi:hypothetical protein